MPKKTPAPNPNSGRRVRRWISLFYALPVLFVLGLLGSMVYKGATRQKPPVRIISTAPFATVKLNDLDARLFAEGDSLRASGNEVLIEFRDAHGKLVDVGEVSFMLALKVVEKDAAQAAIMHSIGKVTRTATPGQYRTNLDPGVVGEWTATLGFSGPHNKAEASFPVKVL